MRLTNALNGQHFGKLAYVRGIITYKLSPFEQKAFPGIFSKSVPNMVRRIRGSIFRFTPPMIIAYLIYDLTEQNYKASLRKNPADYANDV